LLHIAHRTRPVYQRGNRNGAGQLPCGKSPFGDHVGHYPASFDVTADQITETSAVAARATSGSFNGVVYDFSGLSSPITDVTVDPLSTIIPVGVTFTGASVDVNVAGLSIPAGGKYILDVTTGGVVPTPEPSTIALVGAGLVGLATIRRRRSRR
jgi:hypothetical protein